MNPDQREQVRDSARYLRNVRPLDPEELSEYVEGRPHPAAVRQVLREAALDLGLVERADGTFVPVPDEPVPHEEPAVAAFPERYARRLEDLLVEAFGPGWPDGETGDRLRATVRRLKEAYHRGRPVEYDAETALAYAVYHLPDFYAAVRYVLADLTENGLVPRRLRVLDVGAGVGGPALGLFDALPDDALVEYHAVEPSAAADVLEAMLEETGRNVHAAVHRTTAEAFEPAAVLDGEDSDLEPDTEGPSKSDEYDLLLFANVLSELADPVAIVERYLGALAGDGSLVALAPADRETAVGLRAVERRVEDGAGVYAPDLRLWPGQRPTDDAWSFDVRPDLATPAFQSRLDDGSGEFVNVDVQYAYFVLRPDGRRRREVTADPDRAAPLSASEDHVTDRVAVLAVKLSHDLSEGPDANPLFRVGDGSQAVGHFAVLARETTLNRALREADYGDVLRMEGALVLWNDDEGAYNLVVDDETVVDRVA